MSIRNLYERYGVDDYYKNHGDGYVNYHGGEVKYLLEKNAGRIIDRDTRRVLDLCSGNGEVTETLLNMEDMCIKRIASDIVGCDPYMNKIYERRLRRRCYPCSFTDIVNGKLDGTYDVVVCSFGMHLCDAKMLFNLLSMLKYEHGMKRLVVITPNKKPNIRGVIKYEEKYNRVRLRIYE